MLVQCQLLELANGDIERPNSYVIYTRDEIPHIGHVEEILGLADPNAFLQTQFLLVRYQ